VVDEPLISVGGSLTSEHPTGWLEILDRTGKVAGRFPVFHTRMSVGRAYDNDVVLDDPYVCPHHVALSWREGLLQVEDLESVNGVFFGMQEVRLTRELVENDGRFRIGRTVLRFRRHDCPLPATWVDRPLHAPLRWYERPWVLVTIFLGLVLYKTLSFYLTETSSIDQGQLVTEQVALAAVVIAWSALWAFPSRLLMGRWNFLVHCGIAASGIMVQGGVETLLGYACFMIDVDGALASLEHVAGWLVLLAVLYAHMSYLVAAPAGRLLRWAGSVTLTFAALVSLVQYLESREFSAVPDYVMTLKPPPLRLGAGLSRAELLVELDELCDEVKTQQKNIEK